jgi:hypothetical protein
MIPKKNELLKLPLRDVEKLLHGCFPESDVWKVVWPVYETRRRRSDAKRTWICFGISTMIALVALIKSFVGDNTAPLHDAHFWFLESYDARTITVRHEGKIYKARCDESRSFNNAASITDPQNVAQLPTCDLATGLIGQTVQPFDGKQRDADGRIVVMWTVGDTLALRSWRDEHSPWKQETFRIISVLPNR